MVKDNMLPPQGQVLFCEDVRDEVGGTSSLIGVVVNNIGCEQFPATLSKFAAYLTYRQGNGIERRDLELVFSYLDDDGETTEVARHPIALSELPSFADAKRDKVTNVNIALKFTPLHLNKPGVLRVRLYRGSDIIPCGSKRFVLASQETHMPESEVGTD